MKNYIFNALLVIFFLTGCVRDNKLINGSMEQLDNKKVPVGWFVTDMNKKNRSYEIVVDSTVAQDGKYCLSITKKGEGLDFGATHFTLAKTFTGKEIELKGYLKVQNVANGFAGLWLRIDGADSAIALDNMQSSNVKGTADWKEYTIKLPYDDEKAVSIVFGGLLVGNGKIWFDNLRLYIDGKSVDQAPLKPVKKDTSLNARSLIDTVKLDDQKIKNLTLLAQVWGFLKYHHPAIAEARYNMDMELFKVLPGIVSSKNDAELSDKIEKWVDRFGKPDLCINCKPDTTYNVARKPDYGSLFNGRIFRPSLTKKLKYILDNRNHLDAMGMTGRYDNYYVKIKTGVGNVQFNHEAAYDQLKYPNISYRLVCLFRYWNMIQYFYPDKHLIEEDWNKVLPEFIPRFIQAKNETDYVLSVLALISKVQDTHANIWSHNSALEHYRGLFKLPFAAKFVENKLVVTGYFKDSVNVKEIILPGDIVDKIDEKPVDQLIKKYLPITAASNYPTQLRDLPDAYLLRSNRKNVQVEIIHDKKKKILSFNTINLQNQIDSSQIPVTQPYSILPGNIGYLFPGKYKNADLPKIKMLFKGTKGLIVDMRCYPSDFMPFTFVPFVTTGNAPFVQLTFPDIYNPGLFKIASPIENNGSNEYKGKVIIIVNEVTQSQAEYTVMAFQSSPTVTVIGSTTAGADGDVESIMLPGGIKTVISGLGILYPDGTETQRKGVKIDYRITPTIEGVKNGKDELLEKAKALINGIK